MISTSPTEASEFLAPLFFSNSKACHKHINQHSIPIEQRPWLEACLVRGAVYPPEKNGDGGIVEQKVVQLTPPGLGAENVYNPSFDVTPAELISAIVTEKGVAVRDDEGRIDLSGIV